MSMDPQMMAQMLMQGGQGQAGQNPSAMGQGANLLQRVLMAQALQKQFGQQQQPGMPPAPGGAPGVQGGPATAMNQMQQNPLAGGNV